MKECNICRQAMWDFESADSHECPPKWTATIFHDDDEHNYEVYAPNESQAAEDIADRQECHYDYAFVEAGEVEVHIKSPESGNVRKFRVFAESSITYTAEET